MYLYGQPPNLPQSSRSFSHSAALTLESAQSHDMALQAWKDDSFEHRDMAFVDNQKTNP